MHQAKEVVMAHGNVKNIYRKLGKKIDNLPMRAPWNQAFYEILKELYTPQEAEVLIAMPYGPANFDRVAHCTKIDQTQLRTTLESLCEKGLVFDLRVDDRSLYMPAPLAVGIFEMTMMRTRG